MRISWASILIHLKPGVERDKFRHGRRVGHSRFVAGARWSGTSFAPLILELFITEFSVKRLAIKPEVIEFFH